MQTHFQWAGDSGTKLRTWFLLGMLASFSFLAGCARCAPGKGARLTEKSRKDPSCEKEIEGALQSVVKHLGMQTLVTKGDVDFVMGAGKVVKGYVRDGVEYGWEIGLRKQDGKCSLMAYKREKRQPGKSQTSWANYGSVVLTVCHCQ